MAAVHLVAPQSTSAPTSRTFTECIAALRSLYQRADQADTSNEVAAICTELRSICEQEPQHNTLSRGSVDSLRYLCRTLGLEPRGGTKAVLITAIGKKLNLSTGLVSTRVCLCTHHVIVAALNGEVASCTHRRSSRRAVDSPAGAVITDSNGSASNSITGICSDSGTSSKPPRARAKTSTRRTRTQHAPSESAYSTIRHSAHVQKATLAKIAAEREQASKAARARDVIVCDDDENDPDYRDSEDSSKHTNTKKKKAKKKKKTPAIKKPATPITNTASDKTAQTAKHTITSSQLTSHNDNERAAPSLLGVAANVAPDSTAALLSQLMAEVKSLK